MYRELRREKPTEAFASEAFEGAIRDRPTILFFHGTVRHPLQNKPTAVLTGREGQSQLLIG